VNPNLSGNLMLLVSITTCFIVDWHAEAGRGMDGTIQIQSPRTDLTLQTIPKGTAMEQAI